MYSNVVHIFFKWVVCVKFTAHQIISVIKAVDRNETCLLFYATLCYAMLCCALICRVLNCF
jgi:hypothetical protein